MLDAILEVVDAPKEIKVIVQHVCGHKEEHLIDGQDNPDEAIADMTDDFCTACEASYDRWLYPEE